MQDKPLIDAVGTMARIPQWFVWRLKWDAEEGKYGKFPVKQMGDPFPMDASLPHNWGGFEDTVTMVDMWRAHDVTPNVTYAPGFYLTAECGYWFLDFDKCISNGVYSDHVNAMAGQFPGCFMELSSSGNGFHIIGKGTVPSHAKKHKATGSELYTEKRGIAFGLSGRAWGSADVGGAAIASVASLFFPPRADGEEGEFEKPRADWSGPADDDELVRKALGSESMAAKMGNRASFADLWNADPDALMKHYGVLQGNEPDMALAQHLAFWTGCDGPRIERLMRKSKLYREKWDMHRTYLRELTITNACAQQKDVCKDRKAEARAAMYAPTVALPPLPALSALPTLPVVLAPVITPEVKKLVDDLLTMVTGSGDWDDVHNRVIPAIRASGVPPALMPRLENAVNKRLDLWDAKLPVAKLRALMNPPRMAEDEGDEEDVERPVWIDNYVYVKQGDAFFDLVDGSLLSRASFNATHDRDMPLRGDSNEREDSVKWALHRWDTPVVHDTMYWPGKLATIDYDRRKWANLYSDSSLPDATAMTDAGIAAIERFKLHLWMLCGRRERVYENLLSFMAHCVQFPGKLIRWVPIIKGTEGDGKSMITGVMAAAMGERNVASFGPEIIANSGGFTDWAHGVAFATLEETYMTGRERFAIINRVKQYITNNKVSINPKGGKPKKVINTECKMAFTNHNDGIPLDEEKDRRWFVIFTPYETLTQMRTQLGFDSEIAARSHFDAIFASLEREPGQWRAWLQSLTIPAWFTADGAAMMTDEKKIMAQSGVDDIESLARSIVEEGAHGVTATVLSSACLSSALRQRAISAGMEVPKTTSLHHLFNRLGYMKMTKAVKWLNAAHYLWIKPGTDQDNDHLRKVLDDSRLGGHAGHGG